jgi:hypothetical protein
VCLFLGVLLCYHLEQVLGHLSETDFDHLAFEQLLNRYHDMAPSNALYEFGKSTVVP